MQDGRYLEWVIGQTATKWWHDSADPAELERGLARGAVGVTTNPFLTAVAVTRNRKLWGAEIEAVLARKLPPEQQAEALMHLVVTRAAARLLPEYERSSGVNGYVCAQVNPARAGDRDCMLPMAVRFHGWAPNIAVKLPATAAGLDVLEECIAQGITCTATVSFTVPQAIAVAERHRRGAARARENGVTPGRCFAVIMIGRTDDYLREVAHDRAGAVEESDIRQAGLAVTKRAYAIYRERGYDPVLLVAALRAAHHLTELAGADLIMSIAPAVQDLLNTQDYAREERIARDVPQEVIEKLRRIPEFIKAYEPDGMKPGEFISYGVTQRTLGQFCDAGWKLLESM